MSERTEATLLIGFGVFMVGLVAIAGIASCESENRFMAECQADGRKRYECEALYSGAHPAPAVVPVVIPVSR